MGKTRWLALPLAALTLAACGGSSDKLAKPELISQADKICQDGANKLRALPPLTPGRELADFARLQKERASVIDEGTRKLKRLTPPDSVKSDYDAFINARDGQADLTRKLGDEVDSAGKPGGEFRAVRAELGKRTAERGRLARKIGLKVCGGQAPSTGGSSGSSGTLSKADLIAKADRICQDALKRDKAIPRPTNSISDIQKRAEQVASVYDEAAGKLKQLTPLDSVKSDYAAWVKAFGGRAEVLRKLADAVKAGSARRARAARIEGEKLTAERGRLARKIGLHCG